MKGSCPSSQHVYGTAIQVHGRNPKKFQHQGIGTLLMEEAERVARDEHGSWKIAVIAGTSFLPSLARFVRTTRTDADDVGIGTRDYYRKLGYELDGVYMSKLLV